MKVLITICARKGSKGLPSKNIRPMLGKPLIVHTIDQAKAWGSQNSKDSKIVVSTDGEEIAAIAKRSGALVPFLRPAELATDNAGKIPVLSHLLIECEKLFNESYDVVLDFDPTAPIRYQSDIQNGFKQFTNSNVDSCFSATRARKNPYFNMVERDENGRVKLSKSSTHGFLASRQSAPEVWDLNASIYIYKASFLRAKPTSLWEGKVEIFEMPPETAFDIDMERDFTVVEALMKKHLFPN